MGWKKIYLVASIFFSIRCSTYSLQRCRFSTRTILLCASSCRQLSSRFIRGHVLPPGIFYRNLNLPCKPALHRPRNRPLQHPADICISWKIYLQKVNHEFIFRSVCVKITRKSGRATKRSLKEIRKVETKNSKLFRIALMHPAHRLPNTSKS